MRSILDEQEPSIDQAIVPAWEHAIMETPEGSRHGRGGATQSGTPVPARHHVPSGSLHYKILTELRRQIHYGELRPGDALPPEGELMGRFGVARGTVRQAIAALRADGTIAGPQGRPPIVQDRRLTQSFDHLLSFSAWVRALGMGPRGRLVELALRPADDEAAAKLAVAPGSPIYYLVRVRYADGEPLLIERTAMPRALGEIVARLDLERDSIYEELRARGVIFASAHQEIDALTASDDDARLLRTAPDTPLLRVRRQAFAPDGAPLEWSDDRYLATRVTFTLDNTAANVGLSRHLASAAGR